MGAARAWVGRAVVAPELLGNVRDRHVVPDERPLLELDGVLWRSGRISRGTFRDRGQRSAERRSAPAGPGPEAAGIVAGAGGCAGKRRAAGPARHLEEEAQNREDGDPIAVVEAFPERQPARKEEEARPALRLRSAGPTHVRSQLQGLSAPPVRDASVRS